MMEAATIAVPSTGSLSGLIAFPGLPRRLLFVNSARVKAGAAVPAEAGAATPASMRHAARQPGKASRPRAIRLAVFLLADRGCFISLPSVVRVQGVVERDEAGPGDAQGEQKRWRGDPDVLLSLSQGRAESVGLAEEGHLRPVALRVSQACWCRWRLRVRLRCRRSRWLRGRWRLTVRRSPGRRCAARAAGRSCRCAVAAGCRRRPDR